MPSYDQMGNPLPTSAAPGTAPQMGVPDQQYYQPLAVPTQPQTMVPTPQPLPQATQPPQLTGNTFIADVKTIEIMQMVHPEMASAMINIAIKKFAEETDFLNYFVKDEFKEKAQDAVVETQRPETPQVAATEPSSEISFGGW